MSTVWFTSDLHFGHVNIIEFCNRPYSSVEEMDTDLVRRWNSQVAPGDLVWVVGDICMGRRSESLKRVAELNGDIQLVPGNHDHVWSGAPAKTQEKWRPEYAEVVRIQDEQFALHLGWLGYVEVCHFPKAPAGDYDTRYAEHHPELPDEQWLIHGHVHDLWRQRGRQINVGIDAWGGKLVSMREIVDTIEAGPNNKEKMEWT